MPNEPLSTQNYVQIGDKVLNRTADASITTNDVSLSDRIFVFKKNEDGSIKTVVNTTIQYIVDAFSADATAIKNSTKEYCDGIKADTSQLKADTEALKNAAVTAKTSAESARDSAISAKNSASTSATNASNSASSASASATTATTKASEASASASSASKSATSASTSASNASSSASSASASATSASNSASTATTKASEASTSANQAKGYRDEAKGYRDEVNPENFAPKKHYHTISDVTDLEQATSSVAGLTKLFTALGQNTDGAPTNKAVQDAINGKSNTGHTHDDRYFTESEINNKFMGSTYYKYCDGLLIQWGHFSSTGSHGSDVTITFPKAFSNTNYSVCVQQVAYSSNETWSNTFCHSKTTTNFKFRKIFGESLSALDYIAIGY